MNSLYFHICVCVCEWILHFLLWFHLMYKNILCVNDGLIGYIIFDSIDYILLSNKLKFLNFSLMWIYIQIYLPSIVDFISVIGYTEMIIYAFILNYFSNAWLRSKSPELVNNPVLMLMAFEDLYLLLYI